LLTHYCSFYRRYPLFNYGVLIWTIVSIELTLVWNKIDDVHSIASTGQLIPFVTGITGILRVIWVYIGQRIEKSKVITHLLHSLITKKLIESSIILCHLITTSKSRTASKSQQMKSSLMKLKKRLKKSKRLLRRTLISSLLGGIPLLEIYLVTAHLQDSCICGHGH
jgi:hypothetical protein